MLSELEGNSWDVSKGRQLVLQWQDESQAQAEQSAVLEEVGNGNSTL